MCMSQTKNMGLDVFSGPKDVIVPSSSGRIEERRIGLCRSKIEVPKAVFVKAHVNARKILVWLHS